jgi:putative membrane protein
MFYYDKKSQHKGWIVNSNACCYISRLISLSLVVVLLAAKPSIAQQTGTAQAGSATMVGKETASEFDTQNKQGAAAVGAIRPTADKLSSSDQALMMEVAKGGMMQLEMGKVAAQKASNPEVRKLAQAEVEEQTGLSAKLQEIATAKGVTLPAGPDDQTTAMLSKLQGMSGMDFDRMYVQEGGVKNHELLDQTMGKVESNAVDASLKNLAKAAHPLVKTHLKVSRQVLDKMGNKGRSSTGMP